jgi:membrane-associated phospholipid phosphatase
MIKFLFVLAWPAGMALIAAAAWLLARHETGQAAWAWRGPASSVMRHRADGQEEGALPPAPGRPAGRHGSPERLAPPGAVAGAARFLLVVIAGAAVVFAVLVPLGMLAVHAGPAIDKPFYQWTVAHRVHVWAAVMRRATKIGDSQATWAAAGTAAACLAVTWRRRRWLPPLALGSLFMANKLITHTVHHVVHRVGTPTSPLGTFPSGGSARSVAFYGLIAYLLWREFSGTRRGAIWAAAAVTALGFNEGYSRGYLGLHWLTDVLSGWAYGCLLLVVFVAAVRLAAGPARVPADRLPAGSQPAGTGAGVAGKRPAAILLPKRRPRATGAAPAARQPSPPAADPRSGNPA